MQLATVAIGGPGRVMVEGIRSIAERICSVVAVADNVGALARVIRVNRPYAAIIDCADGSWNLKSVVEHLTAIAPDLAILAFVNSAEAGEEFTIRRFGEAKVTLLANTASTLALEQALKGVIGSERLQRDSLDAEGTSHAAPLHLTERQREILNLVCSAESTKQIAQILGISVRTVEFHKYRLMKRLGMNTVTELILWGIRTGNCNRNVMRAGAGATSDAHDGPIPPADRVRFTI